MYFATFVNTANLAPAAGACGRDGAAIEKQAVTLGEAFAMMVSSFPGRPY
jgi:hypothetical protein